MNCKITQSIYDEQSQYKEEDVTILKEQELRITNKLALNEIFMAEKDASKTTAYSIDADGKDVGRFKSSGVIASTGTGSSGWLYSTRRITQQSILGMAQEVLKREDLDHPYQENSKIKLHELIDDVEEREKLAHSMNYETHFDPNLE